MPDFLLFRSGGRDFALPAGAVLAVGEDRGVVPLPFAPDHVEGLTGSFDRVVPQQCLMTRMGYGDDTGAERTLILVDDGAGGAAIRVGTVDRIVAGRIAPGPADEAGRADAICHGELAVGRRTYSLVRPQALRFLPLQAAGLGVEEPAWPDQAAQDVSPDGPFDDMIVFDCGARRFAAPFATVERIAVMPSVIHPIQAPRPILGRSRDDGALVVSLDGALGIAGAGKPEVVIVVRAGSKEVAFTADATAGMQPCRSDGADGDGTVILPDGGKAERLDLLALADRFARPADEGRAPPLPLAKRREAAVTGRTRVMTVRVNESWYGLSADLVRGVGTPTGYARLHGANRRFDGIAVIGGDAVPAIDLHRVFQAPLRSSAIAAIMLTRDGTVAMMCDAPGQIEDVQTDRIEAVDEAFIAGRISGSTRTIRMIDLRQILQQGRAT